jgi:hypothetical protein
MPEYGDPKARITLVPTGAPAVRSFRNQFLWGTWPKLLVKDWDSGGLGPMKGHPRKNSVAFSGKGDTFTNFLTLSNMYVLVTEMVRDIW